MLCPDCTNNEMDYIKSCCPSCMRSSRHKKETLLIIISGLQLNMLHGFSWKKMYFVLHRRKGRPPGSKNKAKKEVLPDQSSSITPSVPKIEKIMTLHSTPPINPLVAGSIPTERACSSTFVTMSEIKQEFKPLIHSKVSDSLCCCISGFYCWTITP